MSEILCPSTPKKLGLLNTTSNKYWQVNGTLHNILQQQNNGHNSVFGLKSHGKKFNCLPFIYWLPKMHEIPSVARFIIAGKKYINKQVHPTSTLNLCYRQIDVYHKKTLF